MGYVVRTKKAKWYVQLETYPGGKRTARTLKSEALARLGIRPDMELANVKLVLKGINKREELVRIDIKKERIAERLENEFTAEILYLPAHLVVEFERELAAHPGPKKLLSNWRAAKRLVAVVKIPSHDWKRQKQGLYNYFEQKRLSDAYAKKIIRVLNMWGEFFAAKTGGQYNLVPTPRDHAKGRIRKAYEASRRQDKASSGLTLELLRELKKTLTPEQYNWVFVSLWFGLRPEEMRNLDNPSLTEFVTVDGQECLHVKQTKLSALPDDEQWKLIPIRYPEQRLAAEIIKTRAAAIPLAKTIQRHTKGNYKLYAGRKGFSPLMWDKGHDIVEVSSWLGHKSIDRTYRDYMRWQKLKLRKVA